MHDDIFYILALALFACAGALAKWLNRPNPAWRRLFAEAMAAIVVSGIVYGVGMYFNVNHYLIFACCGLSGWTGPTAIDYVLIFLIWYFNLEVVLEKHKAWKAAQNEAILAETQTMTMIPEPTVVQPDKETHE